MRRTLIYLVCMLFAFMTISHQTFACSMAGYGPTEKRIANAKQAFIGKVIKTRPVRFSKFQDEQITIFRVTHNIKGRPRIIIKFKHNTNSGLCGMNFIKGESYIVAGDFYGSDANGFKFNLTSHNAGLVGYKFAGRTFNDITKYTKHRNRRWLFMIGAIIAAALVSVAVFIWKRRPDSA